MQVERGFQRSSRSSSCPKQGQVEKIAQTLVCWVPTVLNDGIFHHLSWSLFQCSTALDSRRSTFYHKLEFLRFLVCCLLSFLCESTEKSQLHLLYILPLDSCRRQQISPSMSLFLVEAKLPHPLLTGHMFQPQPSQYPAAIIQCFGKSKPDTVLQHLMCQTQGSNHFS